MSLLDEKALSRKQGKMAKEFVFRSSFALVYRRLIDYNERSCDYKTNGKAIYVLFLYRAIYFTCCVANISYYIDNLHFLAMIIQIKLYLLKLDYR